MKKEIYYKNRQGVPCLYFNALYTPTPLIITTITINPTITQSNIAI
ncbi:hypothetical protein MNB_SV-12-1950 [hydrothermal vent metagenome]|uniref:Uncharacterized protein n=1 Tax=hydrothermal vent metagenome TaxID=652676 RepID=A0A1W1CKG0_9ZZZZ